MAKVTGRSNTIKVEKAKRGSEENVLWTKRSCLPVRGVRRDRIMGNELDSLSKFLSFILRHKPESIGITLDEHGWANVEELLAGINEQHFIDMAMLEEIVAADNKQRYSFNEDKTLIRANQGHSIPVDVELERKAPPEYLWHGTGEKYVESIREQGLLPKSRLYVHLSPNYETAVKVGLRHGKPVVFKIPSGQMAQAGHEFYHSVNGVWLIKAVPVEYLGEIVEE